MMSLIDAKWCLASFDFGLHRNTNLYESLIQQYVSNFHNRNLPNIWTFFQHTTLETQKRKTKNICKQRLRKLGKWVRNYGQWWPTMKLQMLGLWVLKCQLDNDQVFKIFFISLISSCPQYKEPSGQALRIVYPYSVLPQHKSICCTHENQQCQHKISKRIMWPWRLT